MYQWFQMKLYCNYIATYATILQLYSQILVSGQMQLYCNLCNYMQLYCNLCNLCNYIATISYATMQLCNMQLMQLQQLYGTYATLRNFMQLYATYATMQLMLACNYMQLYDG